MRGLAPYLILAGLIALAVVASFDLGGKQPASGNTTNGFVVGEAALAMTPASLGIVHRVGFHVRGDAPELAYVSQGGSCAAQGLVNDGVACVDGDDGNSWKALFPSGMIDIRHFGAVPDNATPADAAVAAAKVYAAGIGACVYVPSIYPGFSFRSPITLNDAGSDCLKGDRGIKNQPSLGHFGKFADLNFPNDTDGIVVSANNGWYVGGLSIKGDAAASTTPAHTSGIYLNGIEGKVENVFVQNFVICKRIVSSATFSIHDVFCDDQGAYPNITNDYPFVCTEMADADTGASAAFQESGGECRAQAGAVDAAYVSDGLTKWYQICAPVTPQGPGVQPAGMQLSCSGPTEYGVPLWRADGIKVRVGNGTIYANGQNVANAPLKVCGPNNDFTVWDVSAAGGGPSGGGTMLYCNQISATLAAGNTTIVVSSTDGIPTGASILVTADHGIPLATKVSNIADGTHLVLSKAPYITGTVTMNIIQIAVATSGAPSYLQACQRIAGQGTNYASCGYHIEIRFNAGKVPPSGQLITLQWSDPTGYAGYLASQVSDYVKLEPTLVGGWDVGLKHIGLSDGGIEFRPTYIELLNQCASIEKGTYGDVAVFHRVINDPIPDCPGYVDPLAGPTIAAFNNSYRYLNGAGIHIGRGQ